jgi:diguanylate cyclase (GGDEF)-like protein
MRATVSSRAASTAAVDLARLRLPRPVRWLLLAALASMLSYVVYGRAWHSDSALHKLVGELLFFPPVAGSIAISLGRAVRVRQERWAWAAFSLALATETLGELLFTSTLDASLHHARTVTPADICFVLVPPLYYLGFVLLVRSRMRAFRPSLWLDGLVAALACASLECATLLHVATDVRGSTGVMALSLTYLLGDVVLLAAVVCVLALTGLRGARTWLALGCGFVVATGCDVTFLTAVAHGGYRAGGPKDLLFALAMLAISLAAWQPVRPIVARLDGRRLVFIPALSGLLAIAELAVGEWRALNRLAAALALLTLAAVVVRVALTIRENQQMLARAERDATSDALTGLANRRRLMHDLGDALASAAEHQLLLLDLDGFKPYNDRFGHLAGDALLARLGQGLAAALGEGVSAYRLGGDEFCVLAARPEAELGELVARVREALSERGDGFEVTSSCGHAALPREAGDVSAALGLADQRMYAQKAHRGLGRAA